MMCFMKDPNCSAHFQGEKIKQLIGDQYDCNIDIAREAGLEDDDDDSSSADAAEDGEDKSA